MISIIQMCVVQKSTVLIISVIIIFILEVSVYYIDNISNLKQSNYSSSFVEKRFRNNFQLLNPSTKSPIFNTSKLPVPAYVPFRSTFVISPQYKLAACRIQKNLSTILLNLFCYLNTPDEFIEYADTLTIGFKQELSTKTCYKTHADHIGTNKDYETKIVVIRDPVERFLSAYVDKCVIEAKTRKSRCYGCKNMLCLLQIQYDRFLKISSGVLHQFSYEDRHFAPMTWFCDFTNSTKTNYKLLSFGETQEQQKNMITELLFLFSDNGVENEIIEFMTKELTAKRTKHTTSGSSIRESVGKAMRQNKKVMEYLYLLYENDYKAFNLVSPFH